VGSTAIEWADDTENFAAGCTEARFEDGAMDDACRNCYARLMSVRQSAMMLSLGRTSIYTGVAQRAGGNTATWTGQFIWDREIMRDRFARMRGGRVVFVGSMTDLWHPSHQPEMRAALAEEMRDLGKRAKAERPAIVTLTKRAENLLAWQREFFPDGLPPWHWPGVTAGNQRAADQRVPTLRQVRAHGPRVVSVEPMTGPVSLFAQDGTDPGALHGPGVTVTGGQDHLTGEWDASTEAGIGWVICGGESGQKARPTHPDWIRALRDECEYAGVDFHFKQWGEFFEVDSDSRDPETGDHVERDPNDPEDAARFVPGLSIAISAAGRVVRSLADLEEGVPYRHMQRVGKKAAGRLLDGRTHDARPEL
jgi:protein gp37